MCRAENLTGQRFGSLVAESYNKPKWICRCDCGSETTAHAHSLKSGKKASCGCSRHKPRKTEKQNPLIKIYRSMVFRCTDSRSDFYYRYGGRGIKVCDRWLEDPNNFLTDMGPRPTGTSLDRIDNNGDYCPENCRWATKIQQDSNKSNTIFLELEGRRQSLIEWSIELRIPWSTLYRRLRLGWSPSKLLTTPVKRR